MQRSAKQVIVMRKDLNMRKGKMVVQGCHASLGVVWLIEDAFLEEHGPNFSAWKDAYIAWRSSTFTKICVYVNSDAELLAIWHLARTAGLPVKLITDNGLTEFNGVPTITCLAIGPAGSEDIDRITGKLPLL